jgi:hypothetical protein
MTQWPDYIHACETLHDRHKRHTDDIHACWTRTYCTQKTCGEHPDDITMATLIRLTNVNKTTADDCRSTHPDDTQADGALSNDTRE